MALSPSWAAISLHNFPRTSSFAADRLKLKLKLGGLPLHRSVGLSCGPGAKFVKTLQ